MSFGFLCIAFTILWGSFMLQQQLIKLYWALSEKVYVHGHVAAYCPETSKLSIKPILSSNVSLIVFKLKT